MTENESEKAFSNWFDNLPTIEEIFESLAGFTEKDRKTERECLIYVRTEIGKNGRNKERV